jgi:hypothetical protein
MSKLLPLAALFFLCGCQSHRADAWPALNLSQPGWKIWNGQAVWQARKSMPELAGDVTVAVNADGTAFVQFTKTLAFATAREDGRRWQIEFPGGRLYSGRYPLPHHFAWLQLPALAQGRPLARPWKEEGTLDEFVVENRRAGETLRGYLTTP